MTTLQAIAVGRGYETAGTRAGKCVPITSVPSGRPLREAGAALRLGCGTVAVEPGGERGHRALQGMVQDVARDHCPCPAALDGHADVPGRVPGRGTERHLARDLVVRFDEIDQPGVDDRLHRVAEQVAIG